ncbi:MAG: YigZ family protein [Myxococcota bacterium]|nr:YigZ family protein [Myxococcota bacterium]
MIILKERTVVEVEKIRGSRFIGYGERIRSTTDATSFLEEVRALHVHASHHCFAWRISTGEERSSDDGEPRGSAGVPILKRLISKQCVQTMLVVVRYFGGTKLGVGGLVRAYGQTADAVLAASSFEEYREWSVIFFRYQYSDTGQVERILARFEHRVMEQSYSEQVSVKISVLKEQVKDFCSLLHEQSGGRIVPTNTVQTQ